MFPNFLTNQIIFVCQKQQQNKEDSIRENLDLWFFVKSSGEQLIFMCMYSDQTENEIPNLIVIWSRILSSCLYNHFSQIEVVFKTKVLHEREVGNYFPCDMQSYLYVPY